MCPTHPFFLDLFNFLFGLPSLPCRVTSTARRLVYCGFSKGFTSLLWASVCSGVWAPGGSLHSCGLRGSGAQLLHRELHHRLQGNLRSGMWASPAFLLHWLGCVSRIFSFLFSLAVAIHQVFFLCLALWTFHHCWRAQPWSVVSLSLSWLTLAPSGMGETSISFSQMPPLQPSPPPKPCHKSTVHIVSSFCVSHVQ